MPLLTVGHGPDDRARLGARLARAGVGLVVDVRRFPGSRSNPDGRLTAHTPSAGAVLDTDGLVQWPGPP